MCPMAHAIKISGIKPRARRSWSAHSPQQEQTMATRDDNRIITPSDPSRRPSVECPRTNSAHQRKFPSQENWRTITYANLTRLPVDTVGNISFQRLYAALRVVGLIS